MVAFQPLNLSEEDSINNLLIQIDNAIQYGEDLDVREMKVIMIMCNVLYLLCLRKWLFPCRASLRQWEKLLK